jgi:hypothetical protein
MSTTASRSLTLGFTGVSDDSIEYTQVFSAAENATSPADNKAVALTTGNNSIAIPATAVAITIIPPVGNTVVLILKGVNGDTGITLSLIAPTSLGLTAAAMAALVINAASAVTVRIIFS